MYRTLIQASILVFSAVGTGFGQWQYLGQTPPPKGVVALFAKGIVSSDSIEHSSPTFSADGKTIVWTVVSWYTKARFQEVRYENGAWSKPRRPSFSDSTADDFYPQFINGGRQLLFSSRRKLPDGHLPKDMSLWVVNHTARGWGKPVPFDTTVSKEEEYASSMTRRGDVFFSSRRDGGKIFDIYSARKTARGYEPPKPLPDGINTDGYEDGPFVSPDGSYLIFEAGRPESIAGSMDLYIAFLINGQWTKPLNMGPTINSTAGERFARVSPDGKYLFFGSTRNNPKSIDIFWTDTGIIKKLRQQQMEAMKAR